MKKIIKILIGFAIILSLSACTGVPVQKEEYTIDFQTNGGSSIEELVVTKGNSFLEPTQPTKEGYEFSGWYSDSLLNNYYNFTSGVMGDVNLYAKWTPLDFTISFEVNGGEEVLSITNGYDLSITLPSDASKEGYTFVGWYFDDIFTEIAEFTSMPARDITLYAKWDIHNFIIAFENNGGEISDIILPRNQEYGTSIVEPVLPARDGYIFEGWYSDIEFVNIYDFTEVVVEDIILYAKWNRNIVTLKWNIGSEPWCLDPGLTGSIFEGDVMNQMYEGLVREIDGIVYPGIAESWETSTDGLTVTFHLRESNWSDGTALTAHDFVYSWFRAMNPSTGSEYSWIWEYTNIVGAKDFAYGDEPESEVGIVALDDYTIEIQLETRSPFLVSLMAFTHFMPVRQDLVSQYPDGVWAKNENEIITNGPFILTDYTTGYGLRLEKNEEYWNKDVVQIDIIEGSFVDDSTTAFAAYNAGDFDFISTVPFSEIPSLITESTEFHSFAYLGTYYYSFNMDPDLNDVNDVGIWNNQKLRLALSYSIDREAITEILGTGQIPAVGFIPPGMIDNEGLDFLETAGNYGVVTDDGNYELALTLFVQAAAELGLTVAELQAALEQEELLYNTSEGHMLIAETIQAMWQSNLGFTIPLANEEWALFQVARSNGDFSIARGGWITDFMDPMGLLTLFHSENHYNNPKYYNDGYNTLLENAGVASSVDEYYENLYDAYSIFMTDMPIISIYHYTDNVLVKDYVTGWGRSVLGPIDFSRATIEGREG